MSLHIKKAALYTAKDSLKTGSELVNILILQIEDLQKLIPKPQEPLILDTNPFEYVEESKEE